MAGFLSQLFNGHGGQDAGNAYGTNTESMNDALYRNRATSDNGLSNALFKYGIGSRSLGDVVNNPQLMNRLQDPGAMDQFYNNMATGATSGSKYATDQVQNNAILGQMYGKGGSLERAGQEEQDLASKGYNLQPQDYEAYGQASGNIARDFDKGESGLAQALAAKGLSQSGSAPRAFMTSQGNKLEMLAQSQRQIADDRMKMNQTRLNQTRSYIQGMTGQAQNAIEQQYNRQLSGAGAGDKERQNLLNAQAAQQAGLSAQGNENFNQQKATGSSGISGAFQQGLTRAIGAAPETAAKAGMAYMTGGASVAADAAGGGGGIPGMTQDQRMASNNRTVS